MHLRMKCLKLWFQHTAARRRLRICQKMKSTICEFQHTAARRRLLQHCNPYRSAQSVSTHSRPKAAAVNHHYMTLRYFVSTHSRPKAAGY